MSRSRKWLIIAIIVAIIIFLFRVKAIAPASILSFVLFAAKVIEKIIRIRMAKAAFDRMNQAGAGAPQSYGNISLKDAIEMFELAGKYTKSDVNKSYKRLMQQNHPDKGGSKYIASEINQARDLLLKNLK